MKLRRPDTVVALVLLLAGLLLWGVGQGMGSTCDSGDSLQHYLNARYAPQHPSLLLDHWSKPLFTLLALPFSQAGFGGVRAFNVLCGVLAAWWGYRSMRHLNLPGAALVPLVFFFASATLPLLLSGLTEPLFACLLSLGTLLCLRGRTAWGMVVISLLPYVRSEGYIVAAVFGLWALQDARDRWYIPLLAAGSLLYAVAGGIATGDLLWQFTRNPYEHYTNYGTGEWLHFPLQYYYFAGLPVLVLTLAGLLAVLLRRQVGEADSPALTLRTDLLLMGPFLLYFAAHVVFWRFSLFHSMGLTRVLLAVLPSGAIIVWAGVYRGLLPLVGALPRVRQALPWVLAAAIILFPFLPSPSGGQYGKRLRPGIDLVLADSVMQWVDTHHPGEIVWGAATALAYTGGRDMQDTTQWRPIREVKLTPPGALLIWDPWFATTEHGVAREMWDSNPQFRLEKVFEAEAAGVRSEYRMYVHTPPVQQP